MISCPKGAIVNRKELTTVRDAFHVALSTLEEALDDLKQDRNGAKARASVRHDLKRYQAVSDSIQKCLDALKQKNVSQPTHGEMNAGQGPRSQ